MSHVSCVTCHLSCVLWHLSPVTSALPASLGLCQQWILKLLDHPPLLLRMESQNGDPNLLAVHVQAINLSIFQSLCSPSSPYFSLSGFSPIDYNRLKLIEMGEYWSKWVKRVNIKMAQYLSKMVQIDFKKNQIWSKQAIMGSKRPHQEIIKKISRYVKVEKN